MEKLEVKSVRLSSSGVLEVHTNIPDNLELAKHVNKDRMEKCLNNHPFEMHIYHNGFGINTVSYKGKLKIFNADQFMDFLEGCENEK